MQNHVAYQSCISGWHLLKYLVLQKILILNTNQRCMMTSGKSFWLFFFLISIRQTSPVIGETGEDLYASGNYSGEITLFEQALTETNGTAQASVLNNIATCYVALEKPYKAVEYYNKAVTADPTYGRGWINLGVILERMNRQDDVLFSYGRVETSDQAIYAESKVKAGTLLAALKRNDEALAAFKAGESRATGKVKIDLYTGIGAVEFMNENLDESDKAFILANEAGPDDAALAWTNLGVLKFSSGKYDEAKSDLETAIRYDPTGKTRAIEYLKKLQKIMGN
jgi:tetratricopeptide (TPR) repeat protein